MRKEAPAYDSFCLQTAVSPPIEGQR